MSEPIDFHRCYITILMDPLKIKCGELKDIYMGEELVTVLSALSVSVSVQEFLFSPAKARTCLGFMCVRC